jgi:hypothetical protein
MEVLLKGSPTDIWYGECIDCFSIVKAFGYELKSIKHNPNNSLRDFAWGDCPVCGQKEKICFHRAGNSNVKLLLDKLQKIGEIVKQ